MKNAIGQAVIQKNFFACSSFNYYLDIVLNMWCQTDYLREEGISVVKELWTSSLKWYLCSANRVVFREFQSA